VALLLIPKSLFQNLVLTVWEEINRLLDYMSSESNTQNVRDFENVLFVLRCAAHKASLGTTCMKNLLQELYLDFTPEGAAHISVCQKFRKTFCHLLKKKMVIAIFSVQMLVKKAAIIFQGGLGRGAASFID
jgi:hypothetical protein